jgi:hypothetical protein
MNRFYKPTPREYVSTHVDVPWEFLQGVAEQKQKGYDAALSTSDAAANLLNFEVNPGDVEVKKGIQKKYNDRILEAQNYVQQTGDFNKASRDIAGIVRDIAQDPYINTMKAAVPIYKEQRKAFDEMKQKGEIRNWWESDFDYMYSTVDKDGNARPYNQNVGVKTADFNKAATDSFGTLNMFKTESGRTVFIDKDGIKRDINEGGGSIVVKDIEARAKTALPAYRNTDAYANHKLRAQKELERGAPDLVKAYEEKGYQAIIDRADALGYENMVSTNLDQLASERKYVQKDDILTKDQREALGLENPNQPTVPLDDVAMTMKGKVFDLGRTKKQYKEAIAGSTKDRLVYKTAKPEDIFDKEELRQYREFMNKTDVHTHLKIFQGKASEEEIQGTYQKFKEYYDAVHLGISSNTKVRMIKGTPELHELLTSQKKADINLYDLEHGGGIGSAAPVLNMTTGEWTTFGELNEKLMGSDQKHVKISLNKEILPYNGIALNAKENGIPEPERFATGYGFTDAATGNQYVFAKPKKYLTQDEKNINKIHTNTWVPGQAEELIVPTSEGGKKAYIVFNPNMPLTEYATRKAKGEPVGGIIVAYKTKEAADRKSNNPEDMLFTPVMDTADPRYMYQSDPVNAYANIQSQFEEEIKRKKTAKK